MSRDHWSLDDLQLLWKNSLCPSGHLLSRILDPSHMFSQTSSVCILPTPLTVSGITFSLPMILNVNMAV